jgi:hypothetical protein
VGVEANPYHGIGMTKDTMFNSFMEIPLAVKKALDKAGVRVRLGRRHKMDDFDV